MIHAPSHWKEEISTYHPKNLTLIPDARSGRLDNKVNVDAIDSFCMPAIRNWRVQHLDLLNELQDGGYIIRDSTSLEIV